MIYPMKQNQLLSFIGIDKSHVDAVSQENTKDLAHLERVVFLMIYSPAEVCSLQLQQILLPSNQRNVDI